LEYVQVIPTFPIELGTFFYCPLRAIREMTRASKVCRASSDIRSCSAIRSGIQRLAFVVWRYRRPRRRQQQDCRAGQFAFSTLHFAGESDLAARRFRGQHFPALFAEALAEDQAFTRQIFAAHMAKLSRELRALCLAWWWSAGIILAGVAGLEVLFRLPSFRNRTDHCISLR
jgi:hypothetical protein